MISNNRLDTRYKRGRNRNVRSTEFIFDGTFNIIRLAGYRYQSHFAVNRLAEGQRITIRRFHQKNIRNKDRFYYSKTDGRFHNFARRDLCLSLNNPNRNGEFLTLMRCRGNNSSRQRFQIQYYDFSSHNGFKPWRVFRLRNVVNRRMSARVTNDNSLLLPTERYAKVQYPARNKNDELYYWDPKVKCLRNFQYKKGCMSYVKQGTSWQLIALGESEHAGRQPHDIKFDGTYLWAMCMVVAPQSNMPSTNDIYLSLT